MHSNYDYNPNQTNTTTATHRFPRVWLGLKTVTSSSSSIEDPIVREQQTLTEDRFRLSLQYAKRYLFGPVESELSKTRRLRLGCSFAE